MGCASSVEVAKPTIAAPPSAPQGAPAHRPPDNARLVVATAAAAFAGTDATVVARIAGSTIQLSGDASKRANLERGSVDTFPFSLSGKITHPPEIEIAMTGAAGDRLAAWKLGSVALEHRGVTVKYPLPAGDAWMRPGDKIVLQGSPGASFNAKSASGKAAATRAQYRLASPKGTVAEYYDVVIVGSGYGGAVSAARFARSGLSVCVLEKGRELVPGDFPTSSAGVLTESIIRLHPDILSGGKTLPGVLPPNGLDLGREDAMYQFDVFGPVTVAHGCGLGGTSLVNAGVTVRPDPRMLTDSKAWPPSFLEKSDELERGFARAEKVLGAAPYPSGKSGYPELPKHEALRRCTAGVGGKFVVPPVLVSFADTRNAQGVDLAACSNCGDCCSGCNVGAKRTLDTSYLADAVNHGAEIHTECSVLHVRGSGGDAAVRGRWAVDYEVLNSGFAVFGDEVGYQTVRADHVVIAAGAPGSTAIMLRTEAGGLALSPRLGESFSGNGDALGIAFNCDDTVRSLGLGGGVESGADTQGPGPCITAIADLRHADLPLEDGIVIEDGTPPGPFVGFFTAAMLALSPIRGVDTDSGFSDKASEVAAYMRSMLHGPYAPEGAMMRTQSHLVMSHDSAMGKIVPTWGSNSSAAGGGGRGGGNSDRDGFLRTLFAEHDVDRSGQLSMTEFALALRSLPPTADLSDQEIIHLMRHYDTNGDGQISYEELAAVLESPDDRAVPVNPAARARAELEAQPVAITPEVVRDSVRDAIRALDEALRARRGQLLASFREFDRDGDSRLSLDEFRGMLRGVNLALSPEQKDQLVNHFFGDAEVGGPTGRMGFQRFLVLLQREPTAETVLRGVSAF